MVYWTRRCIVCTAIALQTFGCGPRLKRASDVSYLFSSAPKSIEAIASDICAALGKRKEQPSSQGMVPQITECGGAGLAAADFDTISTFTFADLPGQTVAEQAASEVFSKSIRTQLWLNRQIPELLSLFTGIMGSGDGLEVGVVKLPEGVTKELGNLLKPVITMLEKPAINMDDLTFSAKLNIVTTGAVNIANDILLNGKVFANGIAITISTGKPYPAYEKSFLRSFDVIILALPFANDIYIDMAVNMSIYNIGLNGPLDKSINAAFGTGLKTMVDALIQVQGKS